MIWSKLTYMRHKILEVKKVNMRYPVKAKKDPKIFSKQIIINNIDELYNSCVTFDRETVEYLFVFSKFLCPHDWLDDNTYLNVIKEIDYESAKNREIKENTIEIKNLLKKNFILEKNKEEILIILKKYEKRTCFQIFFKKVVFYLYNDITVWEGCGYEGILGCNDREVRDGINDIDWLPEPPENLNF